MIFVQQKEAVEVAFSIGSGLWYIQAGKRNGEVSRHIDDYLIVSKERECSPPCEPNQAPLECPSCKRESKL